MLASIIVFLTGLFASPEVEADLWVERFQSSWDTGDFAQANVSALTALEAVQEQGCGVSPLAAQLAFHAAIADQVCRCDRLSGYKFWMALQIDKVTGGLTDVQRTIAQGHSSQRGENRHEDWYFVSSPYTDRRLPDQGVCPDLEMPALNSPSHFDGEVAFAYVELRTTRINYRITGAQPLLSYPDFIGPSLSDRISEGRHTFNALGASGAAFFRFAPCRLFVTPNGANEEICITDLIHDADFSID